MNNYQHDNNKIKLKLYAENMQRLVDSISEMYDELFKNKTLKRIWILTSSPALGNLTLRIDNEDVAKESSYKSLIRILSDICEKHIPIKLAYLGSEPLRGYKRIDTFYNDAEKRYKKIYNELGLENKGISRHAKDALNQAKDLIQRIEKNNKDNIYRLRNNPDISIWACEFGENGDNENKYRAVFYLAIAEKPLMDIKAFSVNNTELAKFLVSIVNNKMNINSKLM